jgi:2-polyprenyl-3-methyl-5-hydroxy-6-metoxy-1,4-benzoquinol methylase
MTSHRHKYEYRIDQDSDHVGIRIARMVGRDKRVLELGSGPGSITRLLQKNGCRITALELDQEALEIVAKHCDKALACNLNDPSWATTVAGLGNYQVIVAADVLEHLYDPWNTLTVMATLLDEDGCVIVSLPHIGHNAIVACLVEADFAYQEWGLLDKTHIRFFGIHNIQQMFKGAGMKIVDAEFVVKLPELTEFADRWRRSSSELKRSLMNNRYGLVYQVVVKAKPWSSAEPSIELSELPVILPKLSVPPGTPLRRKLFLRAKSFLLPYVSLKSRTRIARILDRLGFKL